MVLQRKKYKSCEETRGNINQAVEVMFVQLLNIVDFQDVTVGCHVL